MAEHWSPSMPKMSSALSIVSGASYGSLLGAGLAAGLTVVLAPPVAVPALVTIAGGGAGALVGYFTRAAHAAKEAEPAVGGSLETKGIRTEGRSR